MQLNSRIQEFMRWMLFSVCSSAENLLLCVLSFAIDIIRFRQVAAEEEGISIASLLLVCTIHVNDGCQIAMRLICLDNFRRVYGGHFISTILYCCKTRCRHALQVDTAFAINSADKNSVFVFLHARKSTVSYINLINYAFLFCVNR